MANGNSLFLPAAGCRNGSSLSNAGIRSYYWSSTCYGSVGAWILLFDSDHCYFNYYHSIPPKFILLKI